MRELTALLIALASLTGINSPLAAQSPEQRLLQVTASLGRHQLGVGADIGLAGRLGFAFRAEGFPFPTHAALGAGPVAWWGSTRQARVYAVVLAGSVSCRTPPSEVPCEDNRWRAGLFGGAGVELFLSPSAGWSAGVEGGEWFVNDGNDVEPLDHFTFAAVVRRRL